MNGLFRGFVEDVADPLGQNRVRVRIPSMHGDVPTAAIPWATRMLEDAGGPHGNFFPYHPSTAPMRNDGDGVFVMYENDDQHLPVVVGCWRRTTDAMPETTDPSRRRYIHRTRHGSTIEFGDDAKDFEYKVTMPSGHVIHMRESPGGCGVHITTAGGQKFSLQDEHPGSPEPVVTNTYDGEPVVAYPDIGKSRIVSPPTPNDATGTVQSSTTLAAQGFGEKGIMLRSTSGHEFTIRDVNDGIEMKSANGHSVKISPFLNSVELRTAGGNFGVLQDGVGVTFGSQFGQYLTMSATDFGISWPALNMYLRFGGAENRWKIIGDLKIDCTGDFQILANGNILLQAGGVLTERGASRVEDPPVGP